MFWFRAAMLIFDFDCWKQFLHNGRFSKVFSNQGSRWQLCNSDSTFKLLSRRRVLKFWRRDLQKKKKNFFYLNVKFRNNFSLKIKSLTRAWGWFSILAFSARRGSNLRHRILNKWLWSSIKIWNETNILLHFGLIFLAFSFT